MPKKPYPKPVLQNADMILMLDQLKLGLEKSFSSLKI